MLWDNTLLKDIDAETVVKMNSIVALRQHFEFVVGTVVFDNTVVVDGTVLLDRAVRLDGTVLLHVRQVIAVSVSVSVSVHRKQKRWRERKKNRQNNQSPVNFDNFAHASF